jgi:hypothetical protein
LFDLPPAPIAGQVGVLVRSARQGNDVDRAPWSGMTEIGRTARQSGSAAIEVFRLYRVIGVGGVTDAVALPDRRDR